MGPKITWHREGLAVTKWVLGFDGKSIWFKVRRSLEGIEKMESGQRIRAMWTLAITVLLRLNCETELILILGRLQTNSAALSLS